MGNAKNGGGGATSKMEKQKKKKKKTPPTNKIKKKSNSMNYMPLTNSKPILIYILSQKTTKKWMSQFPLTYTFIKLV